MHVFLWPSMINLPDPAEDTSSVPLETIQASPWHRYAHIYPNLVPNFLNYSLIWNCVCLKWNSEISSRDAQTSFGPLSWAAPHSSTNFSVDTHCSGIHFPHDSLQNPDLSLILRPFVIQKTGINNKLYMTESKEKKKKRKSGAPQQMVRFMVGKENLLYGCSITSWCIFTVEMNNNKCDVGEICGTKVSGCHGDVAAPRLLAVKTQNVSCTSTADMWEINRLMSGCIRMSTWEMRKGLFFVFSYFLVKEPSKLCRWVF